MIGYNISEVHDATDRSRPAGSVAVAVACVGVGPARESKARVWKQRVCRGPVRERMRVKVAWPRQRRRRMEVNLNVIVTRAVVLQTVLVDVLVDAAFLLRLLVLDLALVPILVVVVVVVVVALLVHGHWGRLIDGMSV